jgi:hypothetical protein
MGIEETGESASAPARQDDATGERTQAVPIRIRYRSRLGDHLRAAAYAGRRSDIMFGFGAAVLLAAATTLLVLRDFVAAFIGLVFAGSVLSGWINAPFVWWALRQDPAILSSEIEDTIDEAGILEKTPRVNAHIAWENYREVSETRDAVYLSSRLGVGFIPKRAFSGAQLEELRRIVRARGLVHRPRRGRRILVGLAVLGFFVAAGAAPIVISRLTASPRIELTPVVESQVVSVRGTTDLPDGALVTVQVFHVDEYAREAAAAGGAPSDSVWVLDKWLAVTNGTFEASFPKPDWPDGRVLAVAHFELTIQPQHVTDRYGTAGERLSGPLVVPSRDGGKQVRISKDIELP